VLSRIVDNISACNLNKGDMLREITVKIGLERINMQEGVTVEALLNSGCHKLHSACIFTTSGPIFTN